MSDHDQCDEMNPTQPGWREHIEKMIKDHGRIIIGVFGDEEEPPFQYTIGNHDKSLPELVLIGSSDDTHILNAMSDIMIGRKGPFRDNELVSLGGQYPLKVIKAHQVAKDEYTFQATNYYGHNDYVVMQVLLCDHNGYFPGDAQCAKPYSTCPLLRITLQ